MILPPRPGEPFPDIGAYICERMQGRLAYGEVCMLVRTLDDDGRLVRVVTPVGVSPLWPRQVEPYLVVPLDPTTPFMVTTAWVRWGKRYRYRSLVNQTFLATVDRCQLLVLGEELARPDCLRSMKGVEVPGVECPPPFPIIP